MLQTMTCALASWRSTGPFQRKIVCGDWIPYWDHNRRVTFWVHHAHRSQWWSRASLRVGRITKNIKKLSYVNSDSISCQWKHDQYSSESKRTGHGLLLWYLEKQGVNCVVRQEHGTDIDAACGQLRSNTMKRDREKASRCATLNKGWWIIQN